MQKQLKEPRSILIGGTDRVALYRWATHTIIEQYTRGAAGV